MAFPDFPKAQDILAIARVESRFMENARNKLSRGIMQVNNGPWDVTKNMVAGVKLLREYFELLGNEKAAITAYNCGPANYLKGRCLNVYYTKVQSHVGPYRELLTTQPELVGGEDDGLGERLPGIQPVVAVPGDFGNDGELDSTTPSVESDITIQLDLGS